MLQTILTGIILTAAIAYLLRYAWRTFRGKPTGGCGCANPTCNK